MSNAQTTHMQSAGALRTVCGVTSASALDGSACIVLPRPACASATAQAAAAAAAASPATACGGRRSRARQRLLLRSRATRCGRKQDAR